MGSRIRREKNDRGTRSRRNSPWTVRRGGPSWKRSTVCGRVPLAPTLRWTPSLHTWQPLADSTLGSERSWPPLLRVCLSFLFGVGEVNGAIVEYVISLFINFCSWINVFCMNPSFWIFYVAGKEENKLSNAAIEKWFPDVCLVTRCLIIC